MTHWLGMLSFAELDIRSVVVSKTLQNRTVVYIIVHMKTTLHTKIDKDVKEKAQSLANELGIPISTIINSQLREFVRSGTFQVAREPQLKESVWKEIIKASKDAKQGKNISPEFTNVEDAKRWLNSKDKKWS